jgi:O-antigen/teichoic acid export membrane protein
MSGANRIGSFLKDYLGVGMAKVMFIVAGFINGVLLFRILGESGYGDYQLILKWNLFIGIFGGSWICGGLLRYGVEEYEKSNKVSRTLASALAVIIPSYLTLVVVILTLWESLSVKLGMSGAWTLVVVLGYILTFVLMSSIPCFFQICGRMMWFAFIPVLPALLYTLALVAHHYLGLALTPIQAIGWLTILSLLVLAVSFLRLTRLAFPPRWDGDTLRRILFFSYPIIGFQLLSQQLMLIDITTIKLVTDDSGLVGIYGVSFNIALYMLTMLMMLQTLMTPIVISMKTKKQEGEIVRYAHRIGPQIGWAWVLVCGMALIFSREVIMIYTPDYELGASVLMILCLAAAVRVCLVVEGPVFYAYSMMPSLTVCVAFTVGVNLAAAAFLIPRFGIIGAAWGCCATYTFCSLVRAFWIYHKLKINNLHCLRPIWLLIVIGPAAWHIDSLWLRIILVPCFLLLALVYGRYGRLFTMDSLEIIDRVSMPTKWRNFAHRFYQFMNS